MNRITALVVAGLVLMVGVTPSWAGPPNPTASDSNFNTAGGSGALAFVNWLPGLDAKFNTGFGFRALTGTSGDDNTAMGADSLYHNTTGSWNTAIGSQALWENTTGSFNTASGGEALLENIDGSYNTASGYSALQRNTSGNHNTATGAYALHKSTTGIHNTASGASALFSNSTGSFNTGIGVNALTFNTTGGQNTATGNAALYSNTTGARNTASGAEALFANTDGIFNTATGDSALRSNTSGYSNTASGATALYGNTTGNYNTATGFQALTSNAAGGANTASGANALYYNTDGGNNTASGAVALFTNTTGSNNTATGVSALENNTIGVSNTALGYQALQNSTGGQNIAVGAGAGSVLLSGNKNIHLGHPGASGDNKIMRLGNLQTKTFIAGVTTAAVTGTNVVINASGQLGVPLSSARYKRDIETMGARSGGVLKLRPVTFVYKQDGQSVRQYGLIAEEVATVYPELVTHTATGEVQAVRYQELIPMLVNELQRQQHVTEHLQRELAELRNLVGQMRGGVAQR